MTFLSADELRRAARGSWLALPTEPDRPLEGVSTDTRTLEAGQAFAAIRGEHHDGHAFLAEAHRKGSPLALVDEGVIDPDKAPEGMGLIVTPNTRETLGRIATSWRDSLGPTRVVAITGSAGKTTTARILDAILSRAQRGVAPQASYNNDLGVPLTVLRARRGDQYLVCEVGTSARGEIERLARIVRPDVAIITSIGRAHVEGLGSIEGIAREKASLLDHLQPKGVAIVPYDCPPLEEHLQSVEQVLRVGWSPSADVTINSWAPDGLGQRFTLNSPRTGWNFRMPLPGAHNAMNAALAIAAARRLGVDDEAIREGLANVAPAPMRGDVREIKVEGGSVRLINDAYNANPESMLAAIRMLLDVGARSKRRIVILGDMLELGDQDAALHTELARHIASLDDIDRAILIGRGMGHAADHLAEVWPASRLKRYKKVTSQVIASVAGGIEPGDAVLVKASRGVRLERIATGIVERLAAEPAEVART